jgi:hypothetical protein
MEGVAMWMRRLAFPTFVFFVVGLVTALLAGSLGMFHNLFLW